MLVKIKKILKSHKGFYQFLKNCYLPIRKIVEMPLKKREYQYTLNQIQNLDKSKRIVLFIGVPLHQNLGDQAQYFCIKKWIKNHYSDTQIVEVADILIYNNFKNILKTLKQLIKPDDFIMFQSGYRTTDVANLLGEYTHRIVLENFKDTNILIFPQTVNFKSIEEEKKSSIAYLNHPKRLFLARDEISYAKARELYQQNVLLFPDIVTSLIGSYEFNGKRNGVLFCIRHDEEKLYSDEELNQLKMDVKKVTTRIDETDTNATDNIDVIRNNLENILLKKFNEFASYRLIITDRYHGTIFSLISGTPVIVLNSTDHKLSSGVNWFKDIYSKNIFYAETLEDAKKLAFQLYNNQNDYPKLEPYFLNEYYEKLSEKFEQIRR